MASMMQQGADTGTDDKTYNLTSALHHALQGAENSEIYADDGDDQTRQFFEQSRQQYQQIAQQAKQLLHDCLMSELQGEGSGAGGSSAFGFGGGSGGSQDMTSGAVSGHAGSSNDFSSASTMSGGPEGSAASSGLHSTGA